MPVTSFEGEDRRERFRLSHDRKVLVQARGRFSQVGTIQNITRSGLFFEAFGDYERGMTLDLTFPYDPSKFSSGRPQQAQVVRVVEIEGSLKKGVAVKLLSLFLKP